MNSRISMNSRRYRTCSTSIWISATSNEEEATLRKYFEEHGNDIPEEWESYRALFSYIGFEQMNLSQILKRRREGGGFRKKRYREGRTPKEGSFS